LSKGPHAGRILVSGRHIQKDENGKLQTFNHTFYSDDHGRTWQLGGVFGRFGNESQLVELSDGSVMINARDGDNRARPNNHRRRVAVSQDGGKTWSPMHRDETLISTQCHASIERLTTVAEGGRNRLLFANPRNDYRSPKHPYGRVNLSVRISYDEGRTWSKGRTIYPHESAYSDLAVLPDKTIGLIYERGPAGSTKYWDHVQFARFDLVWLTNGEDTLDPRRKATFVKNGKRRAVRAVGGDWKRADGYLEGSGQGLYLYAGMELGPGDFHIRSRISVEKLNGTAASFLLGRNSFGFDDPAKMRFWFKHQDTKTTNFGPAAETITPGKPFLFEVVRRGKILAFMIDGKEIHHCKFDRNAVGKIGFRPWRSMIRVREFSAEGALLPWKDPIAKTITVGGVAVSSLRPPKGLKSIETPGHAPQHYGLDLLQFLHEDDVVSSHCPLTRAWLFRWRCSDRLGLP
ncbi:MAG: exo-alpha-sialidase, partial [Pirellulales bacterium]|nr:exo-alpha-sialidase [Pirellulales bacterium]